MSRVVAAVMLGTALWLSAAVFAPLTSDPGSAWIAALPPWPALAASLASAALLVGWRRPASLWALLPLAALALPWIPAVDAGLLFAGPLVTLVWVAVIALGWGDLIRAAVGRWRFTVEPLRATVAAGLIAIAASLLIAWRIAPMVPGGDEPHYLIITQSLLADGDLRIENNHAQRAYAAYTTGDLPPQYLTRGQDGEIYPVHAPGLPALLMPAFALGGYPGAVLFLAVVMALASALMWRTAWLATGSVGAAWFGWAAVAASATWAFQGILVFPDAPGAAAVACGVWLVLRLDRQARVPDVSLIGVGAAMAMLPWLHTRFAVIAAGFGVLIVVRLLPDWRRVALFLAVPAAGAVAWFAMFQVIYGTPSPLAQWGGGTNDIRTGWILEGVAGLLIDQQFGLLPYAPVLAAGLAGLVAGTAPGWRRATRVQLALVIAGAYLAASAGYAMWWAGASVPARLLVVLLPLFAPAAAVVWHRAGGAVWRAALACALTWTVFATVTLALVDRGTLAWNIRQHKAGLWFEWVAPLLQWTEALPAFFRAPDALGRESLPLAGFYVSAGIWLVACAVTLAVAIFLSRRQTRLRVSAITMTAFLLMLPAGSVVALRSQQANGSAPAKAQAALLERLSEGPTLIVSRSGERLAGSAITHVRMSLPSGNGDRFIGPLPAGTYLLRGESGQVRVGRSLWPIAALAGGDALITLPVSVNALTVSGAAGQSVSLEPISLGVRQARQPAHRAVRYGGVTAFFLDDRAYAEEAAFWVGGSRFASVVLQADSGVKTADLEVSNGPVPNRLSIVGAALPIDQALDPGETVSVPVLFDQSGAARLQIESHDGFVPSAVDRSSRDHRYLGVSVRPASLSAAQKRTMPPK